MAITNQTLQDFLLNNPAQIDFSYFIFSLLLSAVLAFIMALLYVKYGTSISNRKKFAKNFYLLIPTTTLIITIVKSSLALSLGLVGALSIVRFRAAIKEPEELSFLFLSIAIGLGLGANQTIITLSAVLIISLIVFVRHISFRKDDAHNLYITVSGKINKDLTLRKIVEILKKNSQGVHLKRFDKSEEGILEASFLIDLNSFDNLDKIKENLEGLSHNIKISYLDRIGIYN
ncbi:MAG: DUF4956 domain-containing protein [Nanoarchaeota archaeon]|nr:DUF4956 domain-containing protein [Nanoarchaeota archaeon]